jgi:outer membrane protein assembly factor BamD
MTLGRDRFMHRRLVFVISLFTVAVAACCGRQGKVVMRPEERLVVADRLQGEGKCSKAIIEYEQLLSEFPAQSIAERAEFSLASCRMELGDYDLAVRDFEDFMDSYPGSDLVDNAMYMIALCYIEQAPRPERDQTNRVKALSELSLLLREYPGTDLREDAERLVAECRSRLAEKEYLSGDLYLKLGFYEPARIYFDSVLEEYGDTPWAGQALLGKGIALVGEGKLGEARLAYEQLVTDYPASPAGEQASRRLKELRNAIESQRRSSSGE